MAGRTEDFEVRVCPTHRVVLHGAELCQERFRDRFGNLTFCDTAVERTLVERERLYAAEERAARTTVALADAQARAERYKQALHNVNAHIGAMASGSTETEIRREVLEAVYP